MDLELAGLNGLAGLVPLASIGIQDLGPDLMKQWPTLVTQSLVTFEKNSVEDGRLIEAVTFSWRSILELVVRNPQLVYEIDPWKWEEIIAGSYKASGFFDEVVLTPRSGDFGRDVVATKRGFCSFRCIESVKRYGPGRLVEADDVRALAGVVAADHSVSKGIISTTSAFAPKIQEDRILKPLFPNRIELVDGERLIERLKIWAGAPQ